MATRFIIFLIFSSVVCSYPLAAGHPLFKYEGKTWSYRDFADCQPGDFLQKFSETSLEGYPPKAVERYLIQTVPTIGYLRAQNPDSGLEVVDAFGRSFTAHFMVSEAIDRVVMEHNLRSIFPNVFARFEKAMEIESEINMDFYKVFFETASKVQSYDKFREEFSKRIDYSEILIPSKRFWQIYRSDEGKVLRLRNLLLPFQDRFGEPSRWSIDYSKNALILGVFIEWIRENQEMFVDRIQEEANIFEVLHVEFSEQSEADGNLELIELLETITSQAGLENVGPELLLDLPFIKNAEWRAILGIDLKTVAAKADFLEPVRELSGEWIYVPEKNGAVLLKTPKASSENMKLSNSLKYFDELLVRVWHRILVPEVVNVFDEMELYFDTTDWNPEEIGSVMIPGSASSNVRGVSTGWELKWPRPHTVLEDFFSR